MVYPGRLILMGRDPSGKSAIILYAITGRSPSSQARKLEVSDDGIWVKPTDKSILRTGKVDLLIYPSLFILDQGVAVSNGKQTVDVMACLGQSQNAAEVLSFALQKWDYEPDEPNFTPRISGCILSSGGAALNIIKRDQDGSSLRNTYEFTLQPGKGKLIATYSGENKDPLPSFMGEPVDLALPEVGAEGLAEAVYSALAPKGKNQDFRVSVACVYTEYLNPINFDVAVTNRIERKV
jgi:IMP cyclohydrolase